MQILAGPSLKFLHIRLGGDIGSHGGFHCFEHEDWCCRSDVIDWCYEQFGLEGKRWAHSRDGSTIYLQNDIDAFMFRLRWC